MKICLLCKSMDMFEGVKPLYKQMQFESCLDNPEITVGGDVDSENDFLFDSKKIWAPRKIFRKKSLKN